MPFTFAHAAAALPFRRLRLVSSALVVGTLAPDFEYFLRLSPGGGFGHTFTGAFLLSLPWALLVLWIFHAIVKVPLTRLFPEGVRSRLGAYMGPFSFRGTKRFLLIVVSVLIGIATHIIWDSFTHRDTWPSDHWPLLMQTVQVPVLGELPLYKVFQHTSTVVGTLLVCAWVVSWYWHTTPHDDHESAAIPSARKWFVATSIVSLALLGGIGRCVVLRGEITDYRSTAVDALVTAIAIGWWLLLAYAIASSKRSASAGGT